MTRVVHATSSVTFRWPTALGTGLAAFGVAVLLQPVLPPRLAMALLVCLPVILVLLVGLRSIRRRGYLAAATVGVVVATLAYAVLWVIAAPTGFPSDTFGSSDAPITGVYVDTDPGSTRLEVGVGTCNQDPQVTAVETADEVRLSSNEKLPRGDHDDCADGAVVVLDRALGDRTVIDEATGEVVEVRQDD